VKALTISKQQTISTGTLEGLFLLVLDREEEEEEEEGSEPESGKPSRLPMELVCKWPDWNCLMSESISRQGYSDSMRS
jgi:hypothetical protein